MCQSPIWQLIQQQTDDPSPIELKWAIRQHKNNNLPSKRAEISRSKTLAACRTILGVDLILWIPMTTKERSWCIRWRIGWLPCGKPQTWIACVSSTFTKHHSIQCLQMHKRLKIHINKTDDPLSFILNRLPQIKPSLVSMIQRLKETWPVICTLLAELDAH